MSIPPYFVATLPSLHAHKSHVETSTHPILSYIIEICYEAESHARYAGRQKLKIDDFNFALRHDTKKLGRVQELLETDRDLKQRRKFFEAPDEVKVAKEEERAAKRAKKDKDGGEDEGGKGRKKGRGRSKSAKAEGGDLGSDED